MKILRAEPEHLDQLGALFDLYRQFYKEDPDPQGCRQFMADRMANNESVVLVAEDEDGKLHGFTQMYHSFCSVAMKPIIYLYDLYVLKGTRGTGLGRDLMNAATAYAREQGASRLQLETENTNLIGQSLYESLGYEKEQAFYSYSLELKD